VFHGRNPRRGSVKHSDSERGGKSRFATLGLSEPLRGLFLFLPPEVENMRHRPSQYSGVGSTSTKKIGCPVILLMA